MTPTTGERLAMLEVKLDTLEDRVERIDGKVDALDSKLDQVLLELAKRPAAESGWTLSKAGQQALGGVVGAALLYLAQALGLPAVVPSSPPPAVVPSSPAPAVPAIQNHDGE
jgi:hypothetical protein